jgi:D-sedoheptulose 7-phosphate isomerase
MSTATATAVRVEAGERFFAAEAPRVAALCHRMAERFARDGRLLAFGTTAADRSDAAHVAVEFVHPVIVGKRALPALAVSPPHAALLARPDDVVMAFGTDATAVRAGGALTVGFGVCGAEWDFAAPSEDPFVAQELTETLYHVMWELVHVFFDHRGLLSGRLAEPTHDSGAASFLYPFLGEQETDLEGVLADVEASVLAKSREAGELRAATLAAGDDALRAAATAIRARLDGGGALLTLGNGGSATDSMDAVADLLDPPFGWAARRGLDLAADPSILTAVANDIGPEAMFSRQVIAYGSGRDALLAFSTSGTSHSVIAALAEARRRGLVTVAFVGYDGGAILAEGLADHVVVARSEHIPRIQEAHASAWHVLRGLLEAP